MFGQMDDAHLHMMSCVHDDWTGRGWGAIIIWKYASRVWVGVETGWHPCILPRVVVDLHSCGWRRRLRPPQCLDLLLPPPVHVPHQPWWAICFRRCSPKLLEPVPACKQNRGHIKAPRFLFARHVFRQTCKQQPGQVWAHHCEVTVQPLSPSAAHSIELFTGNALSKTKLWLCKMVSVEKTYGKCRDWDDQCCFALVQPWKVLNVRDVT